jgi:hypothetical protein
LQQIKLKGPPRFLLHNDCSSSNLSATDDIADFHLHQVATPKLAIDRQIEKRPISQAAALIEVKADFPDLLWFQSPFCTHDPPGIPYRALGGGEFSFRRLHGRSPEARLALYRTPAGKVADDGLGLVSTN